MMQETNAIVGSGPQSPRGVYRHKIGCLKGVSVLFLYWLLMRSGW